MNDGRRYVIRDLPTQGRATDLEWMRRRFVCDECDERSWDNHSEILLGLPTHVTHRLTRQLVRDVNVMSIREVARLHHLPWPFIMALTLGWSDRVAPERRRCCCRRVLLVDETSPRGHRYVTVSTRVSPYATSQNRVIAVMASPAGYLTVWTPAELVNSYGAAR